MASWSLTTEYVSELELLKESETRRSIQKSQGGGLRPPERCRVTKPRSSHSEWLSGDRKQSNKKRLTPPPPSYMLQPWM